MLPSLVTALVLITCTCGENPAIKVVLTNKGLQYGKHVGAGWIQERLKLVTLPEISGKISLGFLGSVDYNLNGIRVTQCDLPEPSVGFYEDTTGFKTSISGLNIALGGTWATHYMAIHDGGTFVLTLFSMGVTSIVGLGRDQGGHLSLSGASCDAAVGDAKIHFSGGASWIFQPFVERFNIKNEIVGRLCPAVKQYIDALALRLAEIKVSFPVGDVLAVDIPLTGVPVMDASALSFPLKGEFYGIKSHEDPPFQARPFAMPGKPAYMLSVGLSEFTANSASYGYYKAGLLQRRFNDSMIPPSCPVHLTTDSLGHYIPQLPKMFPGLLVELQVYASECPLFSFQPGAAVVNFLGAIKAFAVQKNSTRTPLFKLEMNSTFSGKVWIDSGALKGSMAMENLTLTIATSEVGPFKTDSLEGLASLGIKIGVLSKLNEKLSEGFVLPRMHHTQLVNAVLDMEEGFISMSSDAQILLTGWASN